MRYAKTIVSVLLASCATLAVAAPQSRTDEPDPLCRMLFDQYVVGSGRINHSTRLAATHIVAERGRTNGFWRDVFGALPSDDVKREIACVRVLGKMLEQDALARDAQRRTERTGEISAVEPQIIVGAEVVKALIERGAKAEDGMADHYAIALVRARVPEARELFRKLVTQDPDVRGRESTRFHAAVGLAQLGDPAGYEWLIANAGDPTQTVSNAWPWRVPSYNLDVCCVAALRELAGPDAPRTRLGWETWLRQADKAKLAPARVDLVEQ